MGRRTKNNGPRDKETRESACFTDEKTKYRVPPFLIEQRHAHGEIFHCEHSVCASVCVCVCVLAWCAHRALWLLFSSLLRSSPVPSPNTFSSFSFPFFPCALHMGKWGGVCFLRPEAEAEKRARLETKRLPRNRRKGQRKGEQERYTLYHVNTNLYASRLKKKRSPN